MPSSIKDYRELIQKPWGRMFYEMIFRQLNLSDGKPLKILDFGAGFCVTASHYAENHNVTAVEPDENMLRFRIDAEYQLINGCAVRLILLSAIMFWNMFKIKSLF